MRLREAGKKGIVVAVCTSERKGERKRPRAFVELKRDTGIIGDAHAANGNRQVSLLARESIQKMQEKGFGVKSGDFAENITTQGLALYSLEVGSFLKAGPVLLEVTQIGKECHDPCAIFNQAGECIMPKEGVFTRVVRGGRIKPSDAIEVITSEAAAALAAEPRQ